MRETTNEKRGKDGKGMAIACTATERGRRVAELARARRKERAEELRAVQAEAERAIQEQNMDEHNGQTEDAEESMEDSSAEASINVEVIADTWFSRYLSKVDKKDGVPF